MLALEQEAGRWMNGTVICFSEKDWLEKHAAEELAKYVEAITGLKSQMLPNLEAIPPKKSVIVVGLNTLVDSFLSKGTLKLPASLHEEGFIIKTVKTEGRTCLVLMGGGPRGTLNAVYHYLENICKVGFFWDGEHIPKLEKMPIEDVNITENPRFRLRQYLQGCVFGYTTYWWGEKEWKREIEWAAKHKLNILELPPGHLKIWRKVWKDFGVAVSSSSLSGPPFLPWATGHKWDMRPPYPEGFQDFQAELAKGNIEHARSLGFKVVMPGFLGQVPKEFYEKCRAETSFIDVSWAGFSPPGRFIHPADPLYPKLWKAFMEAYRDRYGTDHLWHASTFGEMRPGNTPEEQRNIKMNNAKMNLEAIRSVDPEGEFVTGSWTFTDRQFWPKDDVKAWLDTFPGDSIQVWELWPEFYPRDTSSTYKPVTYKELDYYFGKPWLMGFLHSYGGQTSLHGDLAGLIRRVKEVAVDPKAKKCLGVAVEMEVIHHNFIFYDLLARLSWKPDEIELDGFLGDYAVRRYGREAAAAMVQCLKQLTASVYGSDDARSPLYQYRLTEEKLYQDWRSPYSHLLSLGDRVKFIPHLRKALEIALEEAGKLGDCILYQHDLIDIARQYLGELFNLHVLRLYGAFEDWDKGAFESEAEILERILDSQEMLLSSSDYFCLQPILDKAEALPNAPEDFAERIRDILTVWAGQILDYARRDYYELVRFYYRPRVDAFLQYLREKLKEGSREIKDEELVPIYSKIEQEWVKKPFKVKKGEKFKGTPMEAAAKIVKEFPLC